MGLHSPVFLLFLLPVCLLAYWLAGRRWRNTLLLAASLVFLAWGQWLTLPLMLALILVNFKAGQRIERLRGQAGPAKAALVQAVALNLAVLAFFKILTGYAPNVLVSIQGSGLAGWLALQPGQIPSAQQVLPPLGLSYVIFQLISYLVDVYHEITDSEKRLPDFALYILLFPKIVAGPIVRYREISAQLNEREMTRQGTAAGLRRFVIGLAKKVLIADQIARLVNPAFGASSPEYAPWAAWLLVIAYALQLYFDFAGTIDMALGLGQVFGFRFPENFNTPYIARNVGEFWRRWHITLSTWFRDYVFYPLEFTRRRDNHLRQQLHVVLIFLLTGLWHGLTPNFAVWGLIQGIAISLETQGFARWLKKTWAPFQHIYTLLIVGLSWAFFRSPSLAYALRLIGRMVGLPGSAPAAPLPAVDALVWAALAAAVLFALPVNAALQKLWRPLDDRSPRLAVIRRAATDILLLALLAGSALALARYGYLPSIYSAF